MIVSHQSICLERRNHHHILLLFKEAKHRTKATLLLNTHTCQSTA
jgi:hypothetical protein